MADDGGAGAYRALLPALQRLDALLARAVTAAEAAYGTTVGADPYRGLYIGPDDVARLLARPPGAPLLADGADTDGEPVPADSPLALLQRRFVLSAFEIDVVLIALAPEIDLRYERLYAYLQDDVTRRRPGVELVLNLLCPTPEAKLAARGAFAPGAPLVREGIVAVVPEGTQVPGPLLANGLQVDDGVVAFLLGEVSLERRLAPSARLLLPAVDDAAEVADAELLRALARVAGEARAGGRAVRFHLRGARGAGAPRVAERLAAAIGAPLLVAELAPPADAGADLEPTVERLVRAARLHAAVLYVGDADGLTDERNPRARAALARLSHAPTVTIFAGEKPWPPFGPGVIDVPLALVDFAAARARWRLRLEAAGAGAEDADLDVLAGRFRLGPEQIDRAVATACGQARLRAAGGALDTAPTADELFAAARAQSARDLGPMARRIEPRHGWDAIVLPPDALAQLQEIRGQATHRHVVYGAWGFDRKLSLGKGLNVLFSGPPGTGKTLAAEILARELRLDLFKIDLSQIVSKYIGETEKNLNRVFEEARATSAILFFDEADALFGRRSEVRDAHDRYANIEIAYLLQKMEEYEGISILATNLKQNLDEAFARRLAFVVELPFPDATSRRRIWEAIWPRETPRAADLDLDFVARQFKLSGGSIKNVALAAAFLAAEEGSPVRDDHVLRAVRRELEKTGRTMTRAERAGCADRLEAANCAPARALPA
jgi:Winged helix domain, variant/ATPase family associated with various cellular activities (AAA)